MINLWVPRIAETPFFVVIARSRYCKIRSSDDMLEHISKFSDEHHSMDQNRTKSRLRKFVT